MGPGPLSPVGDNGLGKGKPKLVSFEPKRFSLYNSNSLFSLSSAGTAVAAAEATAAAPPSPDHHHRVRKPDLQEVGSGFNAYDLTLKMKRHH